MMASTQITCVLFDMDDTLIDWSGSEGNWKETERKHLRLVYDFLTDRGCAPNATLEHFSLVYREQVLEGWAEGRTTLRAPQMIKIMKSVLENFDVLFDESLTIEAVLKAYNWRGMDGVEVFPDVPNALQKLLDRDIKIGILTNAFQPMWMRDAELERFGLLQYFPDVQTRMSAADIGYLKPSPNVFTKALENMGTSVAETIYVGDNLVADISGAQGVGMRAVLREIHSTPSLASTFIAPDAVVKGLDDLLPLVEDWDKHVTPQV
ncbi:MAG: HAD family hydrolase [Anaerolineae bacterium]|nr:HAD family hydrolase [Anaerolineae bacterium]